MFIVMLGNFETNVMIWSTQFFVEVLYSKVFSCFYFGIILITSKYQSCISNSQPYYSYILYYYKITSVFEPFFIFTVFFFAFFLIFYFFLFEPLALIES